MSEQHPTSLCRKQPRRGLQRIADEKKPRYRGHLARGFAVALQALPLYLSLRMIVLS